MEDCLIVCAVMQPNAIFFYENWSQWMKIYTIVVEKLNFVHAFRWHLVLFYATQLQAIRHTVPGGLLAVILAPNKAAVNVAPSPAHAQNITLQRWMFSVQKFPTTAKVQLQHLYKLKTHGGISEFL